MKVTLPTSKLNEALDRVKSVIPGRSPLPILSNVLIVAKEGKLELTATDTDRRLSVFVDAEVLAPGAITVPCDRLSTTISKLDHASVDLHLEKETLVVQSGTRKTTMKGLPAQEFPEEMEVDLEPVKFISEAKQFVGWLKLLSPFQSDEILGRPMLCGIHLQTLEGMLAFHSSDGKSMIRVKTEIPGDEVDCIIPSPIVRSLITSVGKGEVTLDIGERLMQAYGEDWVLTAKLFEGKYVNVEQVISGCSIHEMEFKANRKELIRAIKYVDTFSGVKDIRVIRVKAAGGKVTLTGTLADIGNSTAQLDGSGESEFGVSPKFLLTSLKSFEDDEITVGGGDKGITAIVMESGPTTVIVMPMRLQ